ncbi:MAG: alkaline phosphatase family protein [Phycisphaerae bacterium]
MSTVHSAASGTKVAARAGGKRPLRPLVKRVLILGLDGATWDVLDRMIAAGRMPALQKLIERGAAGVLHSTKPPITPAAWTTLMTGKGPGRHGIVDFEKYHVRTHELTFNSTFEIREKTLWELLSDKGLRVGSINVPMTYPPQPINGFMISGFETPSTDADFTYPRELKRELLREFPHYNYRTNWQRKTLGGVDILKQNLDYICDSFVQGSQLTRYCGDKFGWDLLMIVYKLVDNLQHKAWKYLDPRFNSRYPREAELTADCFNRLDAALAMQFEYAEQNEALVLIMSDHGHGSLDGKAQPNLLLERWGYLALRSPWQQAVLRGRYWMHRLSKGNANRFEQGSRGIERDLAVDWTRTRACVMHAGIYGFLYINLKGRGPIGIVEPRDYEALREEIAQRLREAKTRDRAGNEIAIFPEVYKTEQLYGCRRADYPDLPDLLLSPRPGLAVVRKIRGSRPVRWCPERRLEGTHRAEGIIAIGGPGVRPGQRIEGNIIDITPTALAALGLRVPLDMEGQVLNDAFVSKLVVEREPPVEKAAEEWAEVYTDEERRMLEKRLSELGYLE